MEHPEEKQLWDVDIDLASLVIKRGADFKGRIEGEYELKRRNPKTEDEELVFIKAKI
jgi:hypothetical protein